MKWKFIAEFEDGSFIEQTEKDESTKDKNRNCFYDVLNHSLKLVRFTFCYEDIEYGVNLETLNFNINGREFRLHTDIDLPIYDVKIHQFRVSTIKQKSHLVVGEDLQWSETGVENFPPEYSHMQLGWAGKDRSGKEIVKFIEFE